MEFGVIGLREVYIIITLFLLLVGGIFRILFRVSSMDLQLKLYTKEMRENNKRHDEDAKAFRQAMDAQNKELRQVMENDRKEFRESVDELRRDHTDLLREIRDIREETRIEATHRLYGAPNDQTT